MTLCRIVLWVFAAAYLAALALFALGTYGWFGVTPDPLSGVYLLPLGLPWVLIALPLPPPFLFWGPVLAPLVNLGIILVLCRRTARLQD